MKQLFKIIPLFFSTFLFSCNEPATPEEQQEEIEQVREQAQQLQEKVQEMRPTIDAEAQKTINRVERRIESQESP